jgi:protein-disulfide isomerase
MKAKPARPSPSKTWPAVLLGLALAEVVLALYQWRELWVVRGGGHAVCALGETVNCETVWNLPVAAQLHAWTLLPVAGLGLLWALCALALSVGLWWALRRGDARALDAWTLALRIVGALGLLACVYLGSASYAAKVVCLTCLATYALTLAFAATAAWGLPRPMPALSDTSVWTQALGRIGAVGVAAYLALLGPGLATPKKTAGSVAKLAAQGDAKNELATFLAGLPPAEQQAVAESLELYRREPPPETTAFAVRHLEGPADAPVKLVEFTDLLCGHCQALQTTLEELRRVSPPGSFSVEPRQFPLDGECNKLLSGTDGRGLRCLGAKVQICLEGAPDCAQLRRKLFDAQRTLTRETLWGIASSGSTSRAELEKCVASPATQAKLEEDIAYAARFSPQGTPLVLVNGREGTPVPAFLYAMILTRGNANAPELATLPGVSSRRNR